MAENPESTESTNLKKTEEQLKENKPKLGDRKSKRSHMIIKCRRLHLSSYEYQRSKFRLLRQSQYEYERSIFRKRYHSQYEYKRSQFPRPVRKLPSHHVKTITGPTPKQTPDQISSQKDDDQQTSEKQVADQQTQRRRKLSADQQTQTSGELNADQQTQTSGELNADRQTQTGGELNADQQTQTSGELNADQQTQTSRIQNADQQTQTSEDLPTTASFQEQSQSEPSSEDLENCWEDLKMYGEPRIVVSVICAYNEWTPTYDLVDHSLLKKALKHVARNAERCGFIYEKQETDFVKGIISSWCSTIADLPKTYMYGYSSVSISQARTGSLENQARTGSLNNMLEIEKYINSKVFIQSDVDSQSKIRVPVVLLVLNGDLDTLDHVMGAINSNISVVVVKGTGGAADLIASCLEDSGLTQLKRELPIMFKRRFTKEVFNEVKNVCNLITEKEWMISVFDIKEDDHDKLWERITDGIIRAWSFEDEKLDDSFLKTEFPSIDGGKYISKIFADNKKQRDAFFTAFTCEKTTIMQQMLTINKQFRLSDEDFHSLWKQEITSKRNEVVYNLLQAVYPANIDNSSKSVTGISKKLLQDLVRSHVGMKRCCKCCSNKIDNTDSPDKKPQLLTIEILRVAVLLNKKENAAELWYQNDFQIMTALIASMYLTSLAKIAKKRFEENLQKEYQSHAKTFLSRAIQLFDKMFAEDESLAKYALEYVSSVWDYNESPLHFGHQFSIEEFISHSSNQKIASKILFSVKVDSGNEGNRPSANPTSENQTQKIANNAYPMHITDVCLFVKHHLENSRLHIITAPFTRIVFHVVFFLAALIMFSYFLIVNLEADSISVLEGLIFVYMLGDLFEEIWSMIRPEKGCNWAPLRIFTHLSNIWNILDFLCFTLYVLGFCMHIFDSNLLVTTRRIYSLALFIMFLRLLNLLLLTKRFGIIIIMAKEMLVDLFEYLLILIIFMFAAGVVYHANVYPNHEATGSSDIEFWRIWTIIKIPYWQVYGELYLDTLEASDASGCTDNATLLKTDPSVERCPTGDWITPVIAAFYMMLTNWLLLNIVIAMFSARFDAIQEKSEEKWRYYRHSVIIDYEDRIPSPLNLPFRFVSLLNTTKYTCDCALSCQHTCRRTCKRDCPSTCPVCPTEKGGANNLEKMLEKQRQFAKEIIYEEKYRNTI